MHAGAGSRIRWRKRPAHKGNGAPRERNASRQVDVGEFERAASGGEGVQRLAAAEAYAAERAYDVKRMRRGALLGVLRAVLLALAVPVLVAAVFVASYALTCILDGATPEELMDALAALFDRSARSRSAGVRLGFGGDTNGDC